VSAYFLGLGMGKPPLREKYELIKEFASAPPQKALF
jgi:hypothetical protein